MDTIYVVLQGESKGPFSRAQLQEMLGRGEITPETLAWREGMANWLPLVQIISPAAPVPAVQSAPVVAPGSAIDVPMSSESGYSREDLRHLAVSQGLLMWAVLTNIVTNITARFLPHKDFLVAILFLSFLLCVVVFIIFAVARLASALRYPIWAIVLYCIAVIIPCVGLICMVILAIQASKILKAAGVRVGLMGARVDDIP